MAVGNSLTARKSTGIAAYLTQEAVKNQINNVNRWKERTEIYFRNCIGCK